MPPAESPFTTIVPPHGCRYGDLIGKRVHIYGDIDKRAAHADSDCRGRAVRSVYALYAQDKIFVHGKHKGVFIAAYDFERYLFRARHEIGRFKKLAQSKAQNITDIGDRKAFPLRNGFTAVQQFKTFRRAERARNRSARAAAQLSPETNFGAHAHRARLFENEPAVGADLRRIYVVRLIDEFLSRQSVGRPHLRRYGKFRKTAHRSFRNIERNGRYFSVDVYPYRLFPDCGRTLQALFRMYQNGSETAFQRNDAVAL